MPIADLSDLVNRWTTSSLNDTLWYTKLPVSCPQYHWVSLWAHGGNPPGAVPTTVTAPTNSTAGSLGQASPSGGRTKYLMNMMVHCGGHAWMVMLYDRLLHIGGLSGSTGAAQTVGGSITRYTDGAGNMIWSEIYTTVGTTLSSASFSYTNQAGTSGRTATTGTYGSFNFRDPPRAIMATLQSGDTGVQAVASMTGPGTGTAGNVGVVIAHPLAYMTNAFGGVGGTSYSDVMWRDYYTGLPGPLEIADDACLGIMLMAQASTTSTSNGLFAGFNFVEA